MRQTTKRGQRRRRGRKGRRGRDVVLSTHACPLSLWERKTFEPLRPLRLFNPFDLFLRKHLPPAGGLERVAVMDDLRFTAGSFPDDRDHVESRRLLEQPVSFEEGQRQPRELRLLVRINRFVRLAGNVGAAGLDFDEHNAHPVARDGVDLPQRGAVTPRQNLETLAAQVARRQPFSLVPQPTRQPAAARVPEETLQPMPDRQSGEDAGELHGTPPTRGRRVERVEESKRRNSLADKGVSPLPLGEG